MAVNEQIVTGRKFRKLIDEATKLWQRISFWTKSSDVEFDDGENAETKVGAIKGITTDTNVTIPGYAADMTVIKEINGNIGAKIRQIIVPVNTANTYVPRNFTYPDGMDESNSVVIPVLANGDKHYGANATMYLHGREIVVFASAVQNYHINLIFIKKNI